MIVVRKGVVMELSGKVKWFDSKKGYGFIEPDDKSDDLFVHFSDIVDEGNRVLDPGEKVKFEVGETPYGRRALKVHKVE